MKLLASTESGQNPSNTINLLINISCQLMTIDKMSNPVPTKLHTWVSLVSRWFIESYKLIVKPNDTDCIGWSPSHHFVLFGQESPSYCTMFSPSTYWAELQCCWWVVIITIQVLPFNPFHFKMFVCALLHDSCWSVSVFFFLLFMCVLLDLHSYIMVEFTFVTQKMRLHSHHPLGNNP